MYQYSHCSAAGGTALERVRIPTVDVEELEFPPGLAWATIRDAIDVRRTVLAFPVTPICPPCLLPAHSPYVLFKY